ncbi:hypothetical protein K3495_g6047 [Podosphaera aphanis]|nr:hypothetical protein K3495_g6047 [Podosphaera aphanis]
MTSNTDKPSEEVDIESKYESPTITGISIAGVQFATAEKLEESLKESNKKTEIWSLSTRLDSIEKLIFLTQSSAAFLEDPPYNSEVIIWSGWWAAKLKETAPNIRTTPSASARSILFEIASASESNVFATSLSSTARLCSFQPEINMNFSMYFKEYQKRYQILKEHSPFTATVRHHMKNLLLFQIHTITECRKWTTAVKAKNTSKLEQNQNKEGYYPRKDSGSQKQILSVESSDSASYQLDTGADYHVSSSENDFYCYSAHSKSVCVAGGSTVNTLDSGDILFPTSDGKIEHLNGAIHISGESNRILSAAQLERQGFSIRWLTQYKDVELIRSSGTVCARFLREFGRLIWRPTERFHPPKIYAINRDWHSILGHPGQKAQDAALDLAKIKGYKYSSNCESCTKTKLTRIKGHGILRTSVEFLEAIHMDLVGGQKSLLPTTVDSSIPTATWFLLAVDENTTWKWAWPISNKKKVSTTVQHFLEHFHKQHNKTPKRIYTDSGTEFSNSAFQEILQSRGIEWSKSSSHAPEQNGIAERNVRTVTEKMRALHINSGLPLKLWPLIFNAAINILNITPNVNASKPPLFTVYNKTPNIKNLHPFSCRVFWLDPEQNKLKAKAKAKEVIYVGSKFTGGHLILNPIAGRTITRRDIRVHENSFPLRTRILALQSSSRRDLEKVLSGPRAKEWNIVMDKEIKNMTQNKVWTLVPRSEAKGQLMTGR